MYAVTSLLSGALAFLAVPIYARALGADGMGLVELVAVGIELLSFVVSQGLAAGWFRLRFNYEAGPARARFESTILAYLLASSMVLLSAGYFVGPAIAARLTPGIPYYPLWFLAVLAASAGTLAELTGLRLQAEQQSRRYALFTLLRRVAVLGSGMLLVLGFHAGPTGKVLGETLGAAAMAVACIAMLRPTAPGPHWRATLGDVLRYSLPIVPHALAMQFIISCDRLILTHAWGLGAVGVYAIGARVARVIEAINQGMAAAFRTTFIAHAKRFDAARADGDTDVAHAELDALARLRVLIFAVACLVCQGVCATAFEVLRALLPNHTGFNEAWRVVPILALGLLGNASYQIFAQSVLYAAGRVRMLPLCSGFGALTSLAAAVLLISPYGAMGAALSNAIGWVTLAASTFLAGRRALPIPQRLRDGLWLLVTTILLAIGCYALDSNVHAIAPRLACKLVLLSLAVAITCRVADLPRQLFARSS